MTDMSKKTFVSIVNSVKLISVLFFAFSSSEQNTIEIVLALFTGCKRIKFRKYISMEILVESLSSRLLKFFLF